MRQSFRACYQNGSNNALLGEALRFLAQTNPAKPPNIHCEHFSDSDELLLTTRSGQIGHLAYMAQSGQSIQGNCQLVSLAELSLL